MTVLNIDLGKLRFNFTGEWVATSLYQLNDIVKYGGGSYVYTSQTTTGGHLPTDALFWALMVEGFKFNGVYNSTTSYRIGESISHGGSIYVCILDNLNQVPPNTMYWASFADGIQFEGVYSSTVSYQKNDFVSYGSSGYIAIRDALNKVPTNVLYWAKMIDGMSASGAWNATVTYVPNDLISYGANQYKAISTNINQLPTSSDSSGTINPNWILITEGIRARGEWSNNIAYFRNDIVQHGGTSYICKIYHLSVNFNTDLAVSKWVNFSSGVRWRNQWAPNVAYIKNDIIKDEVGSTFIAILDHTSSESLLQDMDSSWSLFVTGAADILPTIENTSTGQSLTVDASGAAIHWLGSTQSDKIFYVAPHGVDSVSSGKNLAVPFASIKYATQQCGPGATIFVKTGTYTEQLPIIIPEHTAIVGDNQRTVFIQPAGGLSDDGITANGTSSMFLMSNGSILNKLTFKGMTGWTPSVTTPSDITSAAIAGVVVRLNPLSPVTSKSPYVLECAAILTGGIGALIDGSVHTIGAKTMVFHGFTIISDNGVGFWVKDGGKAEIVSCFTYYCYFGYSASGGGFIRALNGNNSYGTWGAFSQGYDAQETALTGEIIGRELSFLYTGGSFSENDTLTSSSGGTGIITNAQLSANKLYLKTITGSFISGDTITSSSGGTGSVKSSGISDQKGFVLMLTGLSAMPTPGASISLVGDIYSYVIQSVSGTHIDASSIVLVILAQEKPSGSSSGTIATIRTKYSQIRLTGHDFLSIGTGGVSTTNYPNVATQPSAQGNETQEVYPGRVYYVSTDQDGNFRVGEYFRIDQATGRATLNANAFDLAGLTSLKLGSIGAQIGETINEFSNDATLSGNSNLAVPTEYAVKTYIDLQTASSLGTSVASINKQTLYPVNLLKTTENILVREDEVQYAKSGTTISNIVHIVGTVMVVDTPLTGSLILLPAGHAADTTLTGTFMADTEYRIPDWVTITIGTSTTVTVVDVPRTYIF